MIVGFLLIQLMQESGKRSSVGEFPVKKEISHILKSSEVTVQNELIFRLLQPAESRYLQCGYV